MAWWALLVLLVLIGMVPLGLWLLNRRTLQR